MHLAFIDFIYHYDAGRPESDEPLGGTTSAICFLARELVKTGIPCTFFNRATEKRQAYGITTFPLPSLGEEMEKGYITAYIFCGRWTDELVSLVRANTKAPLIGWMHESIFSSPMVPSLDAFDGMVFVSEWQKKVNQGYIKSHWKQAVIYNAINPIVAHSFPKGSAILSTKQKPPVLLFAGSFARGAFHIPPLLEILRKSRSNFTVEMFCNLDPSRNTEKDEAYIKWIRELPNITHVGMVGQNELARRMQRASIMLAPNPWPETSCIALMEGLASGLSVIATDRAALPETASGFAELIPIDERDEQVRFNMPIDYDAFAVAVLKTLKQQEGMPLETEERLRRQIDYFHDNYQWAQRTTPWLEFLQSLASR